jgi:hypothetical protein
MEVSGYLHAPAALPRYQMDRKLDGPQNLYGHYGEEKHLLPLPEIEPRSSSS